jgi:uncharacterized membrane protein HdeD (DUF308 family)
MNSADITFTETQNAVREVVRLNSGVLVAQGVIMTLLGIAAVIWPQISSVAVDLYVGWFLLFSGVVGLAMMFFAPSVGGFLWSLLTGALALFAGILLVWHPVEGVVSLTLVLVAFFIAEGVFQIAAAFGYRAAFPESWGWMVFSGIADLVLAGVIIAGWPGSAGWALGLIVGVNLITSGVATAMVAFAGRSIISAIEHALPEAPVES